jgi:hypothetical protein
MGVEKMKIDPMHLPKRERCLLAVKILTERFQVRRLQMDSPRGEA